MVKYGSVGSLAGVFAPALLWQSAVVQAQQATATVAPNEVLEEIIVTAQKRSERLIDVPAAVSAVTGADLDRIGAHNLNDFAALVPGLNFQGAGPGLNTLILRGITTGTQPSPLVGVVLDGVPYGSSSSFAFGGLLALDAALWDTERVEVLRGPQGTLYGASAMGGLINYVYKRPSLTRYDAQAEGEVSSTDHGSINSLARLAFGGPLVADKLGFRLAASRQDDDGFLTNSELGDKRINDTVLTNVRGSLLFTPIEALNIELSGIYQRVDRGSADGVIYDRTTGLPAAGELDQGRPRLEPTELTFGQGALNVSYDFEWATLTSVTGYQKVKLFKDPDYTQTPTGFALMHPGLLSPLLAAAPPASTTDILVNAQTEKKTEELRLASSSTGALRWLVGFYFDDENSLNDQVVNGHLANGQLNPVFSPVLTIALPSHYKEYAGFGQLTYELTSQLELSAGLRYSRDDQDFSQANGGLLGGGATVPDTKSNEHQVNYLFTTRYALDSNNAVYARAASGYRPGGPNVILPGVDLPATFKSDSLWNYEAGYKARFWGERAEVQLAAFFINWSDIQLTTAAGGFSALENGGSATSKGIELSGSVKPIPALMIGYSVAYTDAHLKDAIAALGAADGERLPNTARFSGSLYGDYRWPLFAGFDAVAGATVRAMGNRFSSFNASPGYPQFELKSYALVDLRLGLETDRYAVTAFVRNVGNERAEYSAATDALTISNEALVTIARPRTVGVNVTARL